jgi:hypothetical protein
VDRNITRKKEAALRPESGLTQPGDGSLLELLELLELL